MAMIPAAIGLGEMMAPYLPTILAGISSVGEAVHYLNTAVELYGENHKIVSRIGQRVKQLAKAEGLPYTKGRYDYSKIGDKRKAKTPEVALPDKKIKLSKASQGQVRGLFVKGGGMRIARRTRKVSKRRPVLRRKSGPKAAAKRKTSKKTTKRRKMKKRSSKSKFSNFGINGSTFRREIGGNWADSQCVYLGHGAAVDRVMGSFWRAFYAYLMNRLGAKINSWNDKNNWLYFKFCKYKTRSHSFSSSSCQS